MNLSRSLLGSFSGLIGHSFSRSIFSFCSQGNSSSPPMFSELESKELLKEPNQLRSIFLQQIAALGQLKMQSYWKTALTHPQLGYYSTENVFSKDGDFITSPQISSLFGEMVGVWIVLFLKNINVFDEETSTLNRRIRIVQLGGGRGFLIREIIKVFADLKIRNDFDINMIEVSQYNRKAQQDAVIDQFKKYNTFFKFQHQKSNSQMESFSSQNQDKNINISWFSSIQNMYSNDIQIEKSGEKVPLTIFVMNEFFDALPTSILQYTEQGWRQKVFVKSPRSQDQLQLQPSLHKLSQKLTPLDQQPQLGDQIQVSYQSLLTIDILAKMIQKYDGAIVNIDYGDQGYFGDSIRAIKEHKFVPAPYFWQIPGKCDLSAYVNFAVLADFAQKNEGIIAYPVTTQGQFLSDMGINQRFEALQKTLPEQQIKKLESQVQRLTSAEQMGQTYKVQIITKKEYGPIYPYMPQEQNSF